MSLKGHLDRIYIEQENLLFSLQLQLMLFVLYYYWSKLGHSFLEIERKRELKMTESAMLILPGLNHSLESCEHMKEKRKKKTKPPLQISCLEMNRQTRNMLAKGNGFL